MNMLAIEQLLATKWVKTYEKKTIKVGVILMIIVVSIVICFKVKN